MTVLLGARRSTHPEFSNRPGKTFEVFRFRPMYASANMGHPWGAVLGLEVLVLFSDEDGGGGSLQAGVLAGG
jgi:hypothetical protein